MKRQCMLFDFCSHGDKLFCYQQRLKLYLNFLFPVCFYANLDIQKALVCQSFWGLLPWTSLGGAYSMSPNPTAALVEHQRCSITCYVSKKS